MNWSSARPATAKPDVAPGAELQPTHGHASATTQGAVAGKRHALARRRAAVRVASGNGNSGARGADQGAQRAARPRLLNATTHASTAAGAPASTQRSTEVKRYYPARTSRARGTHPTFKQLTIFPNGYQAGRPGQKTPNFDGQGERQARRPVLVNTLGYRW